MSEPAKISPPMMGPMVGLLLTSLQKVIGPSYASLLEHTPWQRYLKRMPSSDPMVAESSGDEFGQVCAHIYQAVGKDLFITFGRYAGLEGGKVFAAMLGPVVAPTLHGLSGVARLQQVAAVHMQFLTPQAGPFSLSNTPAGVEVISYQCGMCSRIKSNEPVCAFIGDGLKSCYQLLTGDQVVVKEVACQAQGKGADCVFRATLR